MNDAPKAILTEGAGVARVTFGDRAWSDVPLVPLAQDAPEPMDLPDPALIVRSASPTAVARVGDERIEGVELWYAALEGESRVRVREVRERKAKGDAFWSRVFRKKAE